MKTFKTYSSLIVLVIISSFCSSVETMKVVRKTNFGRVGGFATDLAQVFYGIPYAAPPERWTAPTDPTPWPGTLDATQLKPMCYQAHSCTWEKPIDCLPEKSEDCLYLNIYAPMETTRKSKKAVMFFLHGGSFEYLTGGALVFNAEMLAKKGDVIVVTSNYRLGAFGFLVTGNTSDDITGNYGIMDQRQALKWVYENIRYFGGDRKKITMFGQSAGAYSTAMHLISGKVDRYFHQAIIQSPPWTIPLRPYNIAIEQGLSFGIAAGCRTGENTVNATCLRSKPADVIATIQGRPEVREFSDSAIRAFMPWIPHIDGDEVKSQLIEGLTTQSFPGKPIIFGTVTEEGLLYIRRGFDDPVNALALIFIVPTFAPNVPSDWAALYPIDNFLDAREELAEMTTDYVFACPTRLIARKLSTRMPVYSYVFDEAVDIPGVWYTDTFCENRTCHGIDLPFEFQSARVEPYVFNEEQLALSDKMVAYLSNFAKDGNPNRKLINGIDWTRYRARGPTSDINMRLTTPEVSNQRGYRSGFCDMWDLSEYK